MSQQWRDPLAPWTPAELENMRAVIYPSLPTFRKDDWSVGKVDAPELCRKLRLERTPEQLAVIDEYLEREFKGRAPFAAMAPLMTSLHMPSELFREVVKSCDKNGDGFIQQNEFEMLFQVFAIQFPGWKLTFEEFVKEADTNKDGKVSIDEAVAWHGTKNPEKGK